MKLAYQVATPEVKPSLAVTAYQGDMAQSFRRLAEVGYDGAELMVADPARIDAALVEKLAAEHRLEIPMVCTGEVFGQDRVSFSDPDDAVRAEAIRRVRAAVDVAKIFGAQINIGRVRGGLVVGQEERSYRRSFDGLREIAEYAEKSGVIVALEPVNSLVLNFINSTHDGLDMVKKIDVPSMRMMLDTGHTHIDDPDVAASVRDAAGVFTYVHLCDSNRRWPGACKIDFAGFVQLLKSAGYDGWLSVEVFQVPDQDTALEKSFEHIAPLLR